MDVSHPHAPAESGYYNGNRFARHGDVRVISAFQPIYSIAHRRIVGLEALARGVDTGGAIVPPARLFDLPEVREVLGDT